MNNRKYFLIACLIFVSAFFVACKNEKYVKIPENVMIDKVKGAWAAKMFGVQYGASMEFMSNGKIFEDEIQWSPEMVEGALNQDDIYVQLSFMMTLEKYGLNVANDSIVKYFANAGFPLCHANLQTRKNYFDGVPVDKLAHPEYSIHCEDIDFQIDADFIGIVNPLMLQSSNKLSKKVGGMIGYADGLYGGMFIAAMEALAFHYDDIMEIVTTALKVIPKESTYAECVRDVIDGYNKYPNDWRKTWQLLEDKWGEHDVCTPFDPFNIDAKINGAYVVMGLLYGGGDVRKTMEIAIRCGQDTDCNSSNAAVVLGIMKGYEALPDEFKSHIMNIADKKFLHTDYTFNKTIDQCMVFMKENVINNGGKFEDGVFYIKEQEPLPAEYQVGFGNQRMAYFQQVKDIEKWRFDSNWTDFAYNYGGDHDPYKVATSPGAVMEVDFEGTGVALLGSWNVDCGKAKVYIDDEFIKEIDTYYREEAGLYAGNRAYLFHKTGLQNARHTLKVVVSEEKNAASAGHKVYIERIVVYE